MRSKWMGIVALGAAVCAAIAGAALARGDGPAAVPASPLAALAGAWTLERVDNVLPDGRHVQLYGPQPQGQLLIDAQGRYALQMVRAQRARFALGDKAKGTPGEYRAAALDGNAHYGRLDVSASALRFRIEHASFPNWDGSEQVRPYTLKGDELVYTVPTPTSGGQATGEVAWRRQR